MNLFQRITTSIRSAFSSNDRTEKRSGSIDMSAGLWESIGGFARSRYDPLTDQKKLASNVGYAKKAILRRAEDISALSISVEERVGAKSKNRWEVNDEHELALLLKDPSPLYDMSSFINLTSQHIDIFGRAAWLVIEDSYGKPIELQLLQPDRLRINMDSFGGISHYQYTTNSENVNIEPFSTRSKKSRDGRSIILLQIPSPDNPFAPNSLMVPAITSIEFEAEIRAYALYYWRNNGTPGLVIEHDGELPSVDVLEEHAKSYNAKFQGALNSGKTAHIWGGKIKTLSPSFKDLDFENTLRATAEDICNFFSVPLAILGNGAKGSLGKDATLAAFYVYQRALNGQKMRIERALSYLATRYKNTRIKMQSPVEDDENIANSKLQFDYTNGVISRAEMRGIRGYEPDDQPNIWMTVNGNVLYSLDASQTQPDQVAAPKSVSTKEVGTTPEPASKETVTKRTSFILEGELRRLKKNSVTLEELHSEWQARAPDIANYVKDLRQAAIDNSENYGEAYEVLIDEGVNLIAEAIMYG
jgi:HK97 family phage portal protein